MLIYDSSNLPSSRATDSREEQRANTLRWIKEQDKNCQVPADDIANPTHLMSRIGNPMHSNELERRLHLLEPSLCFRFNEFNSNMKQMYRLTPQGLQSLFPYCFGLLPERSVMHCHEELIPNPEVYNPGFVIQRSEFNADGSNPYWRKVKKVSYEKTRGWRTVLLKLVNCGVLTPTQVETTFGSMDTPEWQGHIGKAPVTTPW